MRCQPPPEGGISSSDSFTTHNSNQTTETNKTTTVITDSKNPPSEGREAVFAIIKHTNVCGIAQRPTIKKVGKQHWRVTRKVLLAECWFATEQSIKLLLKPSTKFSLKILIALHLMKMHCWYWNRRRTEYYWSQDRALQVSHQKCFVRCWTECWCKEQMKVILLTGKKPVQGKYCKEELCSFQILSANI